MAADNTSEQGSRFRSGTSAKRRSRSEGSEPPQNRDGQADESDDTAEELSFRDAQTALELSLAELQAPDLDIERMTTLYSRARHYAERCEQVLRQVEQEIQHWDPERPEHPPEPYQG
jgi:exodeoxyribonuclease VII small subunit